MSTFNHWNDFQHKNKGKYDSVEMKKQYEIYKKKNNIVRSPKRKNRLEGFQEKHKGKYSPKQLKKLHEQEQVCKDLRRKLSPNRWNECQKKYQGKYTKEELNKKCTKQIKYV